MLYHTTELGVYEVRIYCDLQVDNVSEVDGKKILKFCPWDGIEPVEPCTGMKEMSAQGLFSSESVFHEIGDQTRIDYSLKLEAHLPVPTVAFFMPPSVRDRIASSITHWRISEIAEGFIYRSIRAYERENGRKRDRESNRETIPEMPE